jgi:CsoR family transcriptional regulator, copper-sensing transcriptional repressor
VASGYAKDRENVQARLKRIEGQVRGVERMVAEDRYCIDVLTQVNSIKAALDKVALILLDGHVDHCVSDAIRQGKGEAKIRELTAAIGRYLQG